MTPTRDLVSDPLRDAVVRVVRSYGLELFDLQFRRESIGWVLRVVIDRPWVATTEAKDGAEGPVVKKDGAGGTVAENDAVGVTEEAVGVDDCGHVSRDLSAILDVEPELIGGLDRAYTLEVSSPGLDRPLRDERDYRRFSGRLAKIVTTEPVGGQTAFAGRLSGVEDGAVRIAEGRRVHRVPIAVIKRARLEVEF